MGSLVLVSFLLVGGFYYAKFAYVNTPDDRALLAQTQTATGISGSAAPTPASGSVKAVDELCIGGETLELEVVAGGLKPTRTCNLPANTCKVVVRAPGETRSVRYCCNPQSGKTCGCVDQGTNCDSIFPPPSRLSPQPVPACKINATPIQIPKSTMVSPGSQVAATALAEKETDCTGLEALKNKYASAAPTSAQNPAPPISPTSAATPPPPAQIPAAQGTARPEIGNAFNAQPAGPRPGQTGPSAYSGIQAEAGRTGPAAPGTGTFPAQTAPNGPAFNQAPTYAPGNTPPPVGQPVTNYPGYPTQTSPRAQTTFGNADAYGGYSGGYQRGGFRPGSGFVSGFASLIGGLFSVPTNTIVTYIQSFVSPAQPARPLPASSTPAQPQQVVQNNVVLIPYTVVAPPQPDIYETIHAIGQQQEDAVRATTPDIKTVGNPATAATPSAQSPTTNTETAESSPASTGATPAKAKSVRDLLPGEQTGAPSAAEKTPDATSTESTSSPQWIPPTVVEVGVPVDITDPASYESILAYINGDWTHALRTAVQNKAALAQAESERTSIIAHIESLQEAREAGICDAMCVNALASLQRDLPQWESRIEALQKTVREDAEPSPVPPPTVGQISRVVESLAESSYQAPEIPSPRGPSAAPAVVHVASQETPLPSDEVKGEATVLRIVRGVWDFLKSLFLPSAQAQASQEKCSLFLSLFGKCR